MARLVKPSIVYKRSHMQALKESAHETQVTRLKDPEGDFVALIRRYQNYERGKGLPKGYVPATMYWLVDQKTFIGWVDVRHRLTPKLRMVGGHIGYWIRPSQRNKGYGKEILRLALKKCTLLGIDKVYITCDKKNTGSRKIIESQGGVPFEVARLPSGIREMHFWITNR